MQWPSGVPFHIAGGGLGEGVRWWVWRRSEVDICLIASSGLQVFVIMIFQRMLG